MHCQNSNLFSSYNYNLVKQIIIKNDNSTKNLSLIFIQKAYMFA